MKCHCSSTINNKLKRNLLKLKKTEGTIELIGTSIQGYIDHLEKQFKPGMTWENWGKYWEIHHIKEIDRFNLTIKKERLKAFHYLNVKPITVEEHRKLTTLYMKEKRGVANEN